MTVYCDKENCANNKDGICCSQWDIEIVTRSGEPICGSFVEKDRS